MRENQGGEREKVVGGAEHRNTRVSSELTQPWSRSSTPPSFCLLEVLLGGDYGLCGQRPV